MLTQSPLMMVSRRAGEACVMASPDQIGIIAGRPGLAGDERQGDDAGVFFRARRGLDLVHGCEIALVAGFADGDTAARLVRASELEVSVRRKSAGPVGVIANAHLLRVDCQGENRLRL
jgi:hypothetical protein